MPLATLAEGHYKGIIASLGQGEFCISKTIELPKFVGEGDYLIDINLHHPNVCWLLKIPDCAKLHFDGEWMDSDNLYL